MQLLNLACKSSSTSIVKCNITYHNNDNPSQKGVGGGSRNRAQRGVRKQGVSEHVTPLLSII